MSGRGRRAVLAAMLLLGGGALGVRLFLGTPRFGALPEGARLKRMLQSPNFRDGTFRNVLPTPTLTNDSGFVGTLLESLFTKKNDPAPPGPVPTVKTAPASLDRATDTVIWLGHSSFFVQLDGRRILIDPVLSDHAAPVSFSTRAFPGSNPYTAKDFPDVDLLLISHDHWDHLDYPTLSALRPGIRRVVCGLGVGAHLERWGFAASAIHEGDWGDRATLDGLTVHITYTHSEDDIW